MCVCLFVFSDTYDIVCCFGAMAKGHLTPACLPAFIKVAKPGKLFPISWGQCKTIVSDIFGEIGFFA